MFRLFILRAQDQYLYSMTDLFIKKTLPDIICRKPQQEPLLHEVRSSILELDQPWNIRATQQESFPALAFGFANLEYSSEQIVRDVLC